MVTARGVRVFVKHGLRDGEKSRVSGDNFFKKRLTVVSENFRCQVKLSVSTPRRRVEE
jgi:hypothetical protein